MTLQPDLLLYGTINRPLLSGRASVPSGIIIYQDKDFQITKGVVDFINDQKNRFINFSYIFYFFTLLLFFSFVITSFLFSGQVFAASDPSFETLSASVINDTTVQLRGDFNSNIIKQTQQLISNDYAGKKVSIFAIGKKGNDAFAKKKIVVSNESSVFDDLTFENVADIAQVLMHKFLSGEYDKIVIVYNKFKNAATQEIMTEQFLPIVPAQQVANVNLDYIFEPSKVEIVEQLIPKSLKTQLYKGIRDSFASEHGARMTAMHKATDNAKELQRNLKLSYNKARQAAITNEILEIVGGAEALNG